MLKIGVCVKPVPDPDLVLFDVNSETLTSVYWDIVGADLCALEEALILKEKLGGEVVVFSLSSLKQEVRGKDVLQKAFFFGADRVIRMWGNNFNNLDSFTKTTLMAHEISKYNCDLILCGYKSGDNGGEYFGAALAEILNLPLVTRAINIQLNETMQAVIDKKLEKGKRETYAVNLPAIVTVDDNINQPRYIAILSNAYQEGINKKIETLEPDLDVNNIEPDMKSLGIKQWKPRTKAGKDVDGLSIAEKMKMLRGEKGDKKEIYSGSPPTVASKVCKTLEEWIT